jgi:predicted enzyme related to lactoylglutathione lyase
MITSAKSSTRMEQSCSAFTSGGAHDHPSLTSPDHAEPGNGLLLFFRVDDYDMALPRARALVTKLEEEPHVNPSTGTPEFSLRDPDGYYVTISSLSPS